MPRGKERAGEVGCAGGAGYAVRGPRRAGGRGASGGEGRGGRECVEGGGEGVVGRGAGEAEEVCGWFRTWEQVGDVGKERRGGPCSAVGWKQNWGVRAGGCASCGRDIVRGGGGEGRGAQNDEARM